MAFMSLFKQKKEVKKQSSRPMQLLQPLQPIIPKPRPMELIPGQKPIERTPNNLPAFPVDTNKFRETKELPRFEKDYNMNNTIKDFVSTAQPSKPFSRFPNEPDLPAFEDPWEEPFKSRPLFRGDIKSVDRPAHFNLHETTRKPLFIKTNQYKDAKMSASGMKNTLNEVGEITYRMDNLKEEQDSQFELFHKKVEDVQRKLIYIDRTIFEKGD